MTTVPDANDDPIDSLNESIAERVRRGMEYIDSEVTGWKLAPEGCDGSKLIIYPTATHLHHFAVHGALISGLKKTVDGLTGVANILGAPVDFEEKLVAITSDLQGRIWRSLNAIHRLPVGSDEIAVQTALTRLVSAVAGALNIEVEVSIGERMAVGGILAHNKYDVRGATDIVVRNSDDECLLVIVVKTEETFNDNWYRDSRATQVLVPLYYFNGPVFIATSTSWKMFFENTERNSIFTYPTGNSGDAFVDLLDTEVMG